jgi:hypothetical protein
MQMLVDLTHRVHGMIDFTDVRPVAPGRDRLTSSEIATRRNQRIEELARLLLGEANRALSTRSQRRFGGNGGVAVELGGDTRATADLAIAMAEAGRLFLVQRRLGPGDFSYLAILPCLLGTQRVTRLSRQKAVAAQALSGSIPMIPDEVTR